MKNAIIYIYYVIIPLLIIGLSFGITTFPIALLALLVLLITSHRHTVGLFFLMYGGPLGGIIREMYPVMPIYGVLLQLIGILLMWDLFIDLFKKNSQAVLGMLLILMVFGFFYLIGPMDQWAQNKYLRMCINGVLMLIGYYAFDRSDKIEAEALARILFLGTLCMFAFCIDFYKMSPGTLWDYNWYRDQAMQWFYSQGNIHHMVNYQTIGMLALFGTTIYLSQIRRSRGLSIYYTLCGLQMVMVSGCRQAIFGLLVVVALCYTVFLPGNLQKRSLSRTVWIFAGLLLFYFVAMLFLENTSSDVLSKTLAEGDAGRLYIFEKAWTLFENNKFLGVGIGGFHSHTGDPWPHNFILEILCETGLLGFGILLAMTVFALISRKAGILHVTSNGLFFFLVLFALFFRVMVSSDLTESIVLFSAIFAISARHKLYSTTIHTRIFQHKQ